MEQSILTSVKKAVNIASDDPSFDIDIISAINAEFSILTDLGIGPVEGFVIEDESAEWPDFLDPDEDRVILSKVKMAMNLKTRLLFDPPTQTFLIDSLSRQLAELEWRLNVNREHDAWVDPNPPVAIEESGN